MVRQSLIFGCLALGLLLPLLATVWHTVDLQRRVVSDAFQLEMSEAAKTAATGLSGPMWNLIPEAGAPLLQALAARDHILRVEAFTDTGAVFLDVKNDRDGDDASDARIFEAPVLYGGRRIGTVRLTADARVVAAFIAGPERSIAMAAILAFALSGVVLVVVLWLYRRTLAAEAISLTNNLLRREVAERRRAEAALAESEARFRDFAEIDSDWLWETDATHRFTYFSQHRLEEHGMDLHPFLGMTRAEIGAGEPKGRDWAGHLADIGAHREFRNFEYRLRDQDGGPRVHRTSGRPIFGADGVFRGYRGVSADVTQVKRMELDLLEAKERAEAANEAKAGFLARMSHDLRTPLNAIIGFGEVMAADPPGPANAARYQEYVAGIVESGRYLLDLVNDVLDISLIEAGKLRIEMTACALPAAARDGVARFQTNIARKQLAVSIEVPDDLPPVLADARGLRQVFDNLLSNAVKFTEAGGKIVVRA